MLCCSNGANGLPKTEWTSVILRLCTLLALVLAPGVTLPFYKAVFCMFKGVLSLPLQSLSHCHHTQKRDLDLSSTQPRFPVLRWLPLGQASTHLTYRHCTAAQLASCRALLFLHCPVALEGWYTLRRDVRRREVRGRQRTKREDCADPRHLVCYGQRVRESTEQSPRKWERCQNSVLVERFFHTSLLRAAGKGRVYRGGVWWAQARWEGKNGTGLTE